jgi:hypothetical protein
MLKALPIRLVARYGPRQIVFIGGLGLSAVALVILVCVAYFAGTAPHVPKAAALETLRPPDRNWIPPVGAEPLDAAAASRSIHAAPDPELSGLPHAADPSQAPPIDISDLPPPDHR